MTATTKPCCSVVVPVFNSEQSLPQLVSRLEAVLPGLAERYELILVDDHSRDRSWTICQELAASRPWVRALHLQRNSGQHNALLCGVRAARYEVTITLDDDLQQPPEEIHKLLDRFLEGFDVVYGAPERGTHGAWRNLSSQVTKRTLALAMGVPNAIHFGTFRVFRTDLRRAFEHYSSPNAVLDVLLSWGATRFATVFVEESPRLYGRSNYTLRKLFSYAAQVMTGFSTLPLRLAGLLGFVMMLFGLGVFVYVLLVYLTQGSVPGFPFLASLIVLFSGTQLLVLGIMGEYIATIFNRSSNRPPYVIADEVGDGRPPR